MRPTITFVFAGLALLLTFPGVAMSQTVPPVPPPQAEGSHAAGMRTLMIELNLTDAQKQKIQDLMRTYRAAHPDGGMPGATDRQALHDQILRVLTPVQQAQFKAHLAAMSTSAAGPDGSSRHGGHMGEFASLNLSDQQKAQIESLLRAYRHAHPAGSPRDQTSKQALHDQILTLLTPAQRAQLAAQPAPSLRAGGMIGHFSALNLSDQQREQIRTIVSQYRASHPDANMRDPDTRKALQAQIFPVLTPAQQQQWNDMLKAESQSHNP